jgi:hypothetical protein
MKYDRLLASSPEKKEEILDEAEEHDITPRGDYTNRDPSICSKCSHYKDKYKVDDGELIEYLLEQVGKTEKEIRAECREAKKARFT